MLNATVVEINETNLQQTLEQFMKMPVLFYFWSQRSSYYEQLTPVLDKLAQEYAAQFVLAKVDCDEQRHVPLNSACAPSLPCNYSRKVSCLTIFRSHSRKRRYASC